MVENKTVKNTMKAAKPDLEPERLKQPQGNWQNLIGKALNKQRPKNQWAKQKKTFR